MILKINVFQTSLDQKIHVDDYGKKKSINPHFSELKKSILNGEKKTVHAHQHIPRKQFLVQ